LASPLEVHVAIDTGMGREGAPFNDAPSAELLSLTDELGKSSSLSVTGAMTHFANADLADAGLTDRQMQRFLSAAAFLMARGLPIRSLHVDNSASVLTRQRPSVAGCSFSVRPGIALFGVSPFAPGEGPPLPLRPALSWRAPVVGRKRVPAGTAVSYAGTFVTTRETELALLGIGYADGYNRALSGRGEVLIAGSRAPVLGRVCMDLTVVDVTDIVEKQGASASAIGARATVLGSDGAGTISAWDVAHAAGTIAYEVLTSISARVPRMMVP
jgi:alanine racemase